MKKNIGKKLKSLRIKAGLTQEKLAHKLGVSPSSIGMYEQGRRKLDSDTLPKICKELNTSSDYVLGIDDAESEPKDVCTLLKEFTNYIEKEKNIMLNGKPIKNEQKKNITSALKVAIAVALHDSENQDKNKK